MSRGTQRSRFSWPAGDARYSLGALSRFDSPWRYRLGDKLAAAVYRNVTSNYGILSPDIAGRPPHTFTCGSPPRELQRILLARHVRLPGALVGTRIGVYKTGGTPLLVSSTACTKMIRCPWSAARSHRGRGKTGERRMGHSSWNKSCVAYNVCRDKRRKHAQGNVHFHC